jgi:hypothetical protein
VLFTKPRTDASFHPTEYPTHHVSLSMIRRHTYGRLRPALCVDLDGTLVKSDTVVDSLFVMFRRNPIQALRCCLFLVRGKAAFKSEVARRSILNPGLLPITDPCSSTYAANTQSVEIFYFDLAAPLLNSTLASIRH